MKKQRILITGTGQIAHYAIKKWLKEDFEVYVLSRHKTTDRFYKNIKKFEKDIEIIEGDITDISFLNRNFSLIKPHLILNTAAQTHVGQSFKQPIQFINVTGNSVLYMLEAIRNSDFNSKFITCSTSELFGKITSKKQNEKTPFEPASPYGLAKLMAHNCVKIYRESYNMWSCAGILFNSESPKRGDEFVTKKIVKQAVEIKKRKRKIIELGNLESRRDWQHAKDAINGLWLMSNHKEPDEFVFASGKTHSVKDFVRKTFKYLKIQNWEKYIKVNPLFLRPNDVNYLCGDTTKAQKILGWKSKYDLDDIIKDMVENELKKL